MCFGEEGVELRRGNDATHDTLIVSEEQETRRRDCGNGETERAPGHVHELDGRTAGGDYICGHDGVLMRLSELCSEYRIDCRSRFCLRSECFWGSGGGGNKYVGKEGESVGRLCSSYISPEGSAHVPMGAGMLPRTNQQAGHQKGSYDVGTPSSRTSKQETPRHDDRSLRTPPSISCDDLRVPNQRIGN